MTKKDYQAIARAVHAVTWPTDPRTLERRGDTTARIMAAIADVLAADNPRFDRARFVEACETGRCRGR